MDWPVFEKTVIKNSLNLSHPDNLLYTVTQRIVMGEICMSMKRGSLIKILIVLIAIGLLLGPVVSAGKLYPYRESYTPIPNFNIFIWQLNSGPILYSMHIRAGSQEYDYNITFNENSAVCGDCTTDRFVTVLPFRSGKSLL